MDIDMGRKNNKREKRKGVNVQICTSTYTYICPE